LNDVRETNKWSSIEMVGYGKGYVIADKWWRDLLAGLDWLRRERRMTIVLLPHSSVETINDPRAPAYTSYQLRVHKRARGLIQDEMDVIAFLASDVAVISEDAGFNKKRNRADGGSARWLHFEGRPAFVAKSRFDLPAKILCPKDFDVSTSLAPLFRRVAPGTKAAVRSTQTEKEKSHE
jgi:AAA domain